MVFLKKQRKKTEFVIPHHAAPPFPTNDRKPLPPWCDASFLTTPIIGINRPDCNIIASHFDIFSLALGSFWTMIYITCYFV